MGELEDAKAAVERAQEDVSKADVRTELQSIAASLQEMRDTMSGELTDAEIGLGDADFEGAAPHADHLQELEKHLAKLADNIDDPEATRHLKSARGHLVDFRTRGTADDDRGDSR